LNKSKVDQEASKDKAKEARKLVIMNCIEEDGITEGGFEKCAESAEYKAADKKVIDLQAGLSVTNSTILSINKEIESIQGIKLKNAADREAAFISDLANLKAEYAAYGVSLKDLKTQVEAAKLEVISAIRAFHRINRSKGPGTCKLQGAFQEPEKCNF